MATGFAKALGDRRARLFVGRREESEAFSRLLDAGPSSGIVYVQGPAGIGKTQLLYGFARQAEARGMAVAWLLASAIRLGPKSLEDAVQEAVQRAGASRRPTLLVLDGFEHLGGLESWWREVVLPSLPSDVYVVFAGRNRLEDAWAADPGWRALLTTFNLAPFTAEEVREYLDRSDLPVDIGDRLHVETGGLPIAVALLAEVSRQRGVASPSLAERPELVQDLVARFLQGVPSSLHEQALYACTLTLHLTEGLLAAMLDVQSAQGLFQWLSRLTFIERTPAGLVPHDLVRRLLVEHGLSNSPSLLDRLAYRALGYQYERMKDDAFLERPEGLRGSGYLMAYVHKGLAQPAYLLPHAISPALPEHWPEIEAMIRRHEGEEAVERARRWRGEKGEWLVVTDAERRCRGMMHCLPVSELPDGARRWDPGVATVWRHVREAGDVEGPIWLIRTWMCAEHYQAISTVQTWIFEYCGQLILNVRPSQLWSCIRDPESWLPIELDVPPRVLPGVTFECAAGRYGYLGIDLRGSWPFAWYRRQFEAILGRVPRGSGPTSPRRLPEPSVRLEDLKRALEDVHRPARLARSPLLDSPVVERRCPGGDPSERAAALIGILRELTEGLARVPRDAHLKDVLVLRYFEPPVKMSVAAAELGMGYSTFRRHVSAAVERLAEAWWALEAGRGA